MATRQLIPIEVERLTVPELYTAIRIVQDKMYLAHVHGRVAARNLAWERLSLLEARLAHAESADICLGRIVAAVDSPLAGPTCRRRSPHSLPIVLGLCSCCGLVCLIWGAL